MHIPAFIRLLPKYLRLAAVNVAAWGQTQAVDIARSLFVFFVFIASMTAFGIFVAWIGYAYGNESIIAFGKFLTALTGFIAGFLWLYVMVRVTALTGIALAIAQALPPLIHQLSRPLPSTPIVLPTFFTPAQAEAVIRAIGSLFAALAGISAYVTVFPVYTNIGMLLVVFVLGFFIAFGLFAWDIPPKYPIKQWLIVGAFLTIVAISLWFLVPGPIKRTLGISLDRAVEQYVWEQEISRPTKEDIEAQKQAVKKIDAERAQIRKQLAKNGHLTIAESDRLDELNRQKAAVADPDFLNPDAGWFSGWTSRMDIITIMSTVFALMMLSMIVITLIRT